MLFSSCHRIVTSRASADRDWSREYLSILAFFVRDKRMILLPVVSLRLLRKSTPPDQLASVYLFT